MVPCAAWYVAGSAAARQRAARIRQEPAVEAHRVAGRVAARLGRRLEALRQSESRRPVWEYGGHESLLADDGCYARLFTLQVAGYDLHTWLQAVKQA